MSRRAPPRPRPAAWSRSASGRSPGRAPAQHRLDLVLVEALQRDHVDLDAEPRRFGRGDPSSTWSSLPAARDVREPLGIEAVEADVDPPHAAREQPLAPRPASWLPLVVSVSSSSPSPDPRVQAARPGRARRAAPAARRRSAAPASRRARSAGRRAPRSRRSSAARSFGTEAHPLAHAIAAAEVAAVGDRQPDIADPPSKTVDQRASHALTL